MERLGPDVANIALSWATSLGLDKIILGCATVEELDQCLGMGWDAYNVELDLRLPG